MKVYVAASYPRKAEAIAVADKLKEKGHEIISRWIFEDEGYDTDFRNETEEEMHLRLSNSAVRDIEDVKACDWFLCITGDNLSQGGRQGELGMALVLGKRISIIGPREGVFCHHLFVHICYKSVEEFLNACE